MALTATFLVLAVTVAWSQTTEGFQLDYDPLTERDVPAPPDDAYHFSGFHDLLTGESSQQGRAGLAVFRIESVHQNGCWVYIGRVVEAIAELKTGGRVAFVEGFQTLDQRAFLSREIGLRAYPMMALGKEYLVFVRLGDRNLDPKVRALGITDPIASVSSSCTIRADLRAIREVLPDMRQLADILRRPRGGRSRALQAFVFPRLGTKHEWLRWVVEEELAYNHDFYTDLSWPDARRIADFSESVKGYARFDILKNLAKLTPHPMDHWYFRALSRGARGKIGPDDTGMIVAFDDSLQDVVPRLSIDSFWSILERRTRPMSMWVNAFAQKRDPRLLPIILRHLDPDNLDPSAAEALAHYRGDPAAEEAVMRVATDARVRADKRARALARESLKSIGTPRALATAEQLQDDAEESGRGPEQRK